MKRYEVYYYSETGVSAPLSSKEEVKALLEAEGVFVDQYLLEAGDSYQDGNGNLLLISTFDDGDEEEA